MITLNSHKDEDIMLYHFSINKYIFLVIFWMVYYVLLSTLKDLKNAVLGTQFLNPG